MSNHTKGPWEFEADNWHEKFYVGPAAINMDGTDEAEANARLVCAAPDLLEALIAARKELELYSLDDSGEEYNNPDMNAAIAKATGESQ